MLARGRDDSRHSGRTTVAGERANGFLSGPDVDAGFRRHDDVLVSRSDAIAYRIEAYKSRQSALDCSISSIFHLRFHSFMAFSRRIADSIVW